MEYKYIVNGYKWFDKLNGNTYHAVNIVNTKTKKIIFSSGLTYGYGEQWRYTALNGLISLGLWDKKDLHNHDKIREEIYFTVNENALKRDLKKVMIE